MKGDWLYGMNPVKEALRSGGGVRRIYIYSGRRKDAAGLIDRAGELGVPVRMEPERFFSERFPKGHQGVAAEVSPKEYMPLEELLEVPSTRGEDAFFLVLDGIEDPRNLGALLRTAEAAGVHGVVMQSRRSAGLVPSAVKTSAGASEYIPISVVSNIKHAIRAMKDEGITIVGAEAGTGKPPWALALGGPLAVVAGSEGRGMRRTVREHCDVLTSLPMHGRVSSLNASVAAGVLIYEILRQRDITP